MAFIGDWFSFGFDSDYDDGVRAFERGDDESAVPAFRSSRAKATEPGQRERATSRLLASLLRLARKMSTLGNHSFAREAIIEAVSLRPKFADVRLAAAWIHYGAGAYAAAEAEAQATLDINPSLTQAFIVIGLTRVAGGDVDGGFRLFSSNLAKWRDAPTEAKKALVAWETGDKLAAVDDSQGDPAITAA